MARAIQFKVGKHWIEESVARRLASILVGESYKQIPYTDRNGRWTLDNHNDWWLEKEDDTTYELRWRYDTEERERIVKSLIPFFEHVFKERNIHSLEQSA